MSTAPPVSARRDAEESIRLAAAWTLLAAGIIVWLALRPRGELLWSWRPGTWSVYAVVVTGLAISMSAVWLPAWVRTRRKPAAIMMATTALFAAGVAADAWWSYADGVAFERQVSADRRYRTYVHGWLDDENCRHNIFLHKKTDTSPGPYTAGFRCKMLDSDFIVGPQGFRRHNARPIGSGSPIIMCTGGSVTFGMTTDPADKPYPDMLEDILVEADPLLAGIRVLNAAAPGNDVQQCTKVVRANRRLSPAAVVFYEAINYMPKPLPRRIEPRNSGIATLLDKWCVRAESLLAVRFYSGQEYKEELLRFIQACRSVSATPVLVTFAMPYTSDANTQILDYYDVMQNGQGSAYAAARLVEIHNQIIRETAQETGVPCIDAARELTGREELFIDSCHFTQEGSRLLAEQIAPAVSRLLTPPDSRLATGAGVEEPEP